MTTSTPIVLQLQALAIDESTGVPELLRKALLIATKLGLTEFREWVGRELNGYKTNEYLPEYRKLLGTVKALNPYRGWIPVQFGEPDIERLFREVLVGDSVDHLLELLKSDGPIGYGYAPHEQAMLRRGQDDFAQFDAKKFVGKSQLAGILAAIRNRLLDWALKLEAEGILGEGLTFTDSERRKASMASGINIQNFQGVLGNVSDSTLHQNLNMHFDANDLNGLQDYLRSKGVDNADLESLKAAVATDPMPTQSGKFGARVSAWVGGMLGKAASGAWNIGIAAAGNLLSNAVSHYYGLPTS